MIMEQYIQKIRGIAIRINRPLHICAAALFRECPNMLVHIFAYFGHFDTRSHKGWSDCGKIEITLGL